MLKNYFQDTGKNKSEVRSMWEGSLFQNIDHIRPMGGIQWRVSYNS